MLSCGIISITIGITTFKCLFDGILYTFTTCETAAYENIYFTYFRVSVALDIFTDALSKSVFKLMDPSNLPSFPCSIPCLHVPGASNWAKYFTPILSRLD